MAIFVGTGEIWVLFMETVEIGVLLLGYREDMGPVHEEQGRYGPFQWGTREIWVLFMGNRGRYGSCL